MATKMDRLREIPEYTRRVHLEIINDYHTGQQKFNEVLMHNNEIHGVKDGLREQTQTV